MLRGRSGLGRAVLRGLEDRFGNPVTVGVWLVALSLVAYLLTNRAGAFEYVGIARALQYEISTSVPGSVQTLLVDLYQPVVHGEVVARLDDEPLRARLETERAVIEQLGADLAAEMTRVGFREAGLATDHRRFQVDEQRLHLEILSLRVVLESDRIELERLGLEHRRAEGLGAEGILPQSDIDNLRLLRDRVARRIEENEKLLQETQTEYRAAAARREAYERRYAVPPRDPLLEPLRAGVRAQERRIEEIELQRRALVLRSPVAGRVSQVMARSGQYVLAGEPVAFVEEESASEILAYAPEVAAARISERARVLASRRDAPSPVAESVITRVGAAIEVTPQRLWRDPATPEYGLAFVIAAAPQLKLRPGELVTISIRGR